jgi:hypothetical protein
VNDVPVARQSRGVTEPQREKTHLEYNNPSSEKPGTSGFSGNRILTASQNARREKRSQKSLMYFFDKLRPPASLRLPEALC